MHVAVFFLTKSLYLSVSLRSAWRLRLKNRKGHVSNPGRWLCVWGGGEGKGAFLHFTSQGGNGRFLTESQTIWNVFMNPIGGYDLSKE